MSTPDEPPPLPTASPSEGAINGNPLHPHTHAPLHWRALAFLCDWVAASLLVLLAIRLLVYNGYNHEFQETKAWLSTLWRDYLLLLQVSPTEQAARTADILQQSTAIPEPTQRLMQVITTVQISIFWAYFFTTEFFTQGASLGKRIFNLRTCRMANFTPPGFFDSFIRATWKAFFFGSPYLVFLFIGIVDSHVPLFNRGRRSLHDIFSRTAVLDATRNTTRPS
ncbi:MAG: RDD family protein [Puniceicoccales bacterium]|jgi:uncharacterized RDD family membrane protein YckC|nr:RDD family protein [Puniceicoccales bacterium]